MPGSVFGIPFRPTSGHGVIWSETLGGRMDSGLVAQAASGLSGLTLNRVAFGNSLGGLQDSANLTFDGTTLTNGATTGVGLAISSTQASTNAATGCATFAGGVGILGDVFMGSSAGGSTTITQTGGRFQFGNTQTAYVTAAANSVMYGTNSAGAAYPFLETGNLVISPRISGASRDVVISTRGTGADFVVDRNGNTILGQPAALATNATNGFAYLPSCAGTPTGAPTSVTGKVSWVYDSTNNIIYIYNGAWKKTAALT